MMLSAIEWFAPLLVGVFFTPLGILKVYGLCKGYEGGPGLSFWEKLRAGSCPEEHFRLPNRLRIPFYVLFSLFILGVGLYGLGKSFVVLSS